MYGVVILKEPSVVAQLVSYGILQRHLEGGEKKYELCHPAVIKLLSVYM